MFIELWSHLPLCWASKIYKMCVQHSEVYLQSTQVQYVTPLTGLGSYTNCKVDV